ncbi:hypothetical protein AB6735_18370 [Mucilaginibacter sp. RCC_168]|uniref:hypothetical protein n=1 Tax=Mucilaginibacter sp. RCC_168 TaxID=3239221 RepID=UPI0035237CD1
MKLNYLKSELIQNEFVEKTDGDINLIRKPIFAEIDVKNGGKIQCLSIPSPGSPYRKLNDFGIAKAINLDNYLFEVFKWFKG